MLTFGLIMLSGSYLYFRFKTGAPVKSNRELWQIVANVFILVGALYTFIGVYLLHGKY